MNIKKFNISKPKKYTDRAGVEKTQWNNIGTITEFHKDDGSVGRIIEIPTIGLEANIFPWQPRNQESQEVAQTDMNQDVPFPDGEDVASEEIL